MASEDPQPDMTSCWEEVEGMLLPPLDPGMTPWAQHIPNLRGMKLRQDDILLCAYPKTGTHWVWEVLSMLSLGKAQYESRPKEQLMMEFVDVLKMDALPSPRILNTHLPFSMLPVEEMKAKGVKVVHVYRNPKDTMVSYYHMLKMWPELGVRDLPAFFDVFLSDRAMYGCYFDFLRQMHDFTQANPQVSVMNLSYEDMKTNPKQMVKRLAEFLGLDASDALCKEVEEACRFDNMKRRAADKADPAFSDKAQDDKPASESSDNTQVKMFRKGQVGDWKNHLTVAMSERMDQLLDHKMQGLPFTFHFTQP